MLLIVSEESTTTCDIMKWLDHFGVTYCRVNDKDRKLEHVSVRLNSDGACTTLRTAEHAISLEEVQGCFVRHGYWGVEGLNRDLRNSEFPELWNNMVDQNKTLMDYVNAQVSGSSRLGDVHRQDSNKLIALDAARQFGLAIPDTLITTERSELEGFMREHDTVVCKSIQNVVHLARENVVHINYTEVLTSDVVKKLPVRFYPSKFQGYVDKQFEVRTFFVDGVFRSTAIISQGNAQTKVDFRKYDEAKPNRVVPFELPKEIEGKLRRLMDHLGFETGSIDVLFSRKHGYVFLEVNPVGQFGMVSYPCNYHLERLMAERIIARMGKPQTAFSNGEAAIQH